MENKNNVLLTVLGVCTLLVALVGASFAYFTASASTTNQNVQTGKLEIQSTLSKTTQSQIKPTTFATTSADGNADIAKFTFNVKGVGTTVTGATYNIKLLGAASGIKEVADNGGTLADIEYALYKGTAASGTIVKTGSFTEIADTLQINNAAYTLTNATDDTYTLYVYIKETNENQDNLQGVTISSTMTAEAQTPAPTA
jgi:predicted ribosomally synthesized peptide with SipW-like signal peptide